jgi:hypothetical protein
VLFDGGMLSLDGIYENRKINTTDLCLSFSGSYFLEKFAWGSTLDRCGPMGWDGVVGAENVRLGCGMTLGRRDELQTIGRLVILRRKSY